MRLSRSLSRIGLPLGALAILSLAGCQTNGYPGPDVKTAARVMIVFKS
jgi:hypothetical protein